MRYSFLFIMLLLTCCGSVLGQSPTADSTTPKSPFVVMMQQRGSDEAVRSRQLFEREQISRRQRILLDELARESQQLIFPDDSTAVRKYLDKLTVVVNDFAPLDSSLNATLNSATSLQIRSSFLLHELREAHDDVDVYRRELSQNTLKREFHNIWGEVGFSRPLSEIISISIAKEKLLLRFYLANNPGKVVIFVLLVFLVTWLITDIKKRLKEDEGLDPKERGQLVVRHPWMSAIVIVFSIFQFIFFEPPFIFSFILWLVAAIALTVIFRSFITTFWMRFWLTFVLFFILASLDNFILQASRTERWFMFFLSIAGIIYGGYILKSDKKNELRERKILYFIAFVVILQIASVLANAFGRFNLSKTYFSTGYVGLIIAILFLWAARLINETLKLASHVYKHPDRNMFYINF